MQTINLGNPTGDVGPGDVVICRGEYVTVRRVVIHPPGSGYRGLIGSSFYAVEVITDRGSRWTGGTVAYIGGDLRAHWSRS